VDNKIYIASTNPVKIEAIRTAFQSVFPYINHELVGVKAESGVSHQPFGDEETYTGALNRTDFIIKNHPRASYWIGIEGGIELIRNNMTAFAWIIIRNSKIMGQARTASFALPAVIRELIEQGLELGYADDRAFNRSDSKRQDGTVGFLTGGIIDRKNYYAHAAILALIPFLNPILFKEN
jgi:inosine/xanthosine triphosphatase